MEEDYYYTTLKIDNLGYNVKVDVYKNLPRPTDKENTIAFISPIRIIIILNITSF